MVCCMMAVSRLSTVRLIRVDFVRIDVLTIFPELVKQYTEATILGRAQESGLLDVRCHDLRDRTNDRHRSVDDSPFGGGAGMVLTPDPVFRTVEEEQVPRPLIYLSPTGRPFTQSTAEELADLGGFSLLCGRYEGVDERVREHVVDREISIGDYVLAGGELGALVIIEAVARLVPGVLGNETSSEDESFADGLLEYPHYTRPADYRGWLVPEVLRSGDHGLVERWRLAQSLARTIQVRPDLIEARGGLSREDRALLKAFELD